MFELILILLYLTVFGLLMLFVSRRIAGMKKAMTGYQFFSEVLLLLVGLFLFPLTIMFQIIDLALD